MIYVHSLFFVSLTLSFENRLGYGNSGEELTLSFENRLGYGNSGEDFISASASALSSIR
jgi:hypothetical protein